VCFGNLFNAVSKERLSCLLSTADCGDWLYAEQVGGYVKKFEALLFGRRYAGRFPGKQFDLKNLVFLSSVRLKIREV